MKPKLIILFSLIVLIPLGLLAWLGLRMNHDEDRRAAAQLQQLHTEKLDEWANRIGEAISEGENRLLDATDKLPHFTGSLRAYSRETPGIGQIILIDANRSIIHPPQNLTQNESAFLLRIKPYLEQFPSLHPPMESTDNMPEYGWNHWYYGSGAQFLFWRRMPNGLTIGIEIPRAVMLSKVINILPEDKSTTRYLLRDGSGANMYHWGSHSGTTAVAARELHVPLNMWHLEAFGSPPPSTGLASVIPTLIARSISLKD